MRLHRVLVGICLVAATAGCQRTTDAAVAGAKPFEARPHGTLAQVMRGIPFPNSNLIFDTQSRDPGATKTNVDRSSTVAAGGATGVYSSVYGGWQQVENAAVALGETAGLLMVPGRLCENGLPVPLQDATYRKAVQGLIEAGDAALKAAQSKNLDAMVEVSGTVSDACAACHEKYRDVRDGQKRCVPIP